MGETSITCSFCMKEKKPYNCGLDKCPGYRLHEEQMKSIENAQNRISNGQSTINQVRTEFGLKPLDDKIANVLCTTKE